MNTDPTQQRRLIAAADEATLRALALVDDDEGRMARSEIRLRDGCVMGTADRMASHAARIEYLSGCGPTADLIFDTALGEGRR